LPNERSRNSTSSTTTPAQRRGSLFFRALKAADAVRVFVAAGILTYADMDIYWALMARAATTSDAFNAVAEPQRRRILALLKGRERPVNELARALRITQPRTSKHLRVLREVGLVRVREAGQQRLYGLDARGLQPVHEWVIGFEQYWNENFDRLNEYVKKLQQKEQADGSRS
jgi:DNA-binding transcriptional ArsR family regulator